MVKAAAFREVPSKQRSPPSFSGMDQVETFNPLHDFHRERAELPKVRCRRTARCAAAVTLERLVVKRNAHSLAAGSGRASAESSEVAPAASRHPSTLKTGAAGQARGDGGDVCDPALKETPGCPSRLLHFHCRGHAHVHTGKSRDAIASAGLTGVRRPPSRKPQGVDTPKEEGTSDPVHSPSDLVEFFLFNSHRPEWHQQACPHWADSNRQRQHCVGVGDLQTPPASAPVEEVTPSSVTSASGCESRVHPNFGTSGVPPASLDRTTDHWLTLRSCPPENAKHSADCVHATGEKLSIEALGGCKRVACIIDMPLEKSKEHNAQPACPCELKAQARTSSDIQSSSAGFFHQHCRPNLPLSRPQEHHQPHSDTGSSALGTDWWPYPSPALCEYRTDLLEKNTNCLADGEEQQNAQQTCVCRLKTGDRLQQHHSPKRTPASADPGEGQSHGQLEKGPSNTHFRTELGDLPRSCQHCCKSRRRCQNNIDRTLRCKGIDPAVPNKDRKSHLLRHMNRQRKTDLHSRPEEKAVPPETYPIVCKEQGTVGLLCQLQRNCNAKPNVLGTERASEPRGKERSLPQVGMPSNLPYLQKQSCLLGQIASRQPGRQQEGRPGISSETFWMNPNPMPPTAQPLDFVWTQRMPRSGAWKCPALMECPLMTQCGTSICCCQQGRPGLLEQNLGLHCPVPPPGSFPPVCCHRVAPGMCPCMISHDASLPVQPYSTLTDNWAGTVVTHAQYADVTPVATGRTVPPAVMVTDHTKRRDLDPVKAGQDNSRERQEEDAVPDNRTINSELIQCPVRSTSTSLSFPPNPPPTPDSMSYSGLLADHSGEGKRWSTGNAPPDPAGLSACKAALMQHLNEHHQKRGPPYSSQCPYRFGGRDEPFTGCGHFEKPVLPGASPPSAAAQYSSPHRCCCLDRTRPACCAHLCSPPCLCFYDLLSRLEQQVVQMENSKEAPSQPASPNGTSRQLPVKPTLTAGDKAGSSQPGRRAQNEVMNTGSPSTRPARNGVPCEAEEATVSRPVARFEGYQPPESVETSVRWSELRIPRSGEDEGNTADWSLAVEFDSTSHQRLHNFSEAGAGNCNAELMNSSGQSSESPSPMSTTNESSKPGQFEGKKNSTPAGRRTNFNVEDNASRKNSVTDADIRTLCDQCIFNACSSMESRYITLQRQQETEDYQCCCMKEEGSPITQDECQYECRCLMESEPPPPVAEQQAPGLVGTVSTCPGLLPTSVVNVHVSVQVESTFDSTVMLEQVKKDLMQALDEVKDCHQEQLRLRQQELECHQQALKEVSKLAMGSRARADPPKPLTDSVSFKQPTEPPRGVSGGDAGARVQAQKAEQSAKFGEIRVVEWRGPPHRGLGHIEPAEEETRARDLPVSRSLSFLHLY